MVQAIISASWVPEVGGKFDSRVADHPGRQKKIPCLKQQQQQHPQQANQIKSNEQKFQWQQQKENVTSCTELLYNVSCKNNINCTYEAIDSYEMLRIIKQR